MTSLPVTGRPDEVTTRAVVVMDFETTGLYPGQDRAIEVAAVLLVDHRPVESFSELMFPGFALPPFITELTGITNEMLRGRPAPEKVMPRLHGFVRGLPVIAHNASFDAGFLNAELRRAGLPAHADFLCTMRLARRLVPGLPSYRLHCLVDALQVRTPTCFHRAEADVAHTIAVWQRLHDRFVEATGITSPPLSVMRTLMGKPRRQVPKFLAQLGQPETASS